MKDIFRKSLATLLVMGMTLTPALQSVALAQEDWEEEEQEQPQVVKLEKVENLNLSVGQSQIVYVNGINKVIVNTPDVVDLTVLNDREIMILGKSAGATDLLIFGEGARKDFRIEVKEEAGGIEDQIANLLGVRTVEVVRDKGIVFLKGTVPNEQIRARAIEITRAYSGRVVDLLAIGSALPSRGKSASAQMSRMMLPEPTLQERILEQTGGAMIEVEENDTSVVLKGIVDDEYTIATAEAVTKAFSTKKIINLIKMETQYFNLADEIKNAINCPSVKVKLVYQGGQIPKDNAKIDPDKLTVLLEGTVPTGAKRQVAEEISKAFNGNVINHLTIAEPQQVVVEAKFVEVSTDITKELGLTWGEIQATSGGYGDEISTGVIRFAENIGVDQRGDATVTGAPVSEVYNPFYFSNLNRLNPLAFTLKANADDNEVKVLSSPRILTLSGTEASLQVGGQVPVTTVGKDGNPVTEWKDYGIALSIKPTVDTTGKIRADIDTEVSDLDYSHADSQGNPAVKTKSAKTVVYVHDKDTIVISGLMTNQKAKQKNGIPYLMNIPVLGKLFSSTRWVDSKSELLVFLTPRVVTAPKQGGNDIINPPIRESMTPMMDTVTSAIVNTDKRVYDMNQNGPVDVTMKAQAVKEAKKTSATPKKKARAKKRRTLKYVQRAQDSASTRAAAKVSVQTQSTGTAGGTSAALSAPAASVPVAPAARVAALGAQTESVESSVDRQRKIKSLFKDIASRIDSTEGSL